MLNARRIGGSLAALGVLAGLPSIPFLFGLTHPLLVLPIIAGVGGCGYLVMRWLWRETATLDALLWLIGSTFLAGITLVLMFFAMWVVTADNNLCGSAGAPPIVALFGSYFVIGVWGFQRPKRLAWAWPLAIAVAFATSLGLTAALPGGHGFCED